MLDEANISLSVSNMATSSDVTTNLLDTSTQERETMSVRKVVIEGVKKFNCEECGKNFSGKRNLIQHLIIHSVANPFK